MKKALSLLLTLVMVLSLCACGQDTTAQEPNHNDASQGQESNQNSAPEQDDPAPEDVTPEVPEERVVTVTDRSGDEVTITGEVKEIVNLWPAVTTSFFVMGAGDLITATSNNAPGAFNPWAHYFYPDIERIASMGGNAPAVEDIVAQAPDLVIVHPTTVSSGLPQQIRDMGIPAVNINFSLYEEMIEANTTLGEILGGEYQTKLDTWCESVQTKIDAHRALVAGLADEDKPVVYYIAGQADDLLTTMASTQIMRDWVESNGGIYASNMMEITGNGLQGSNVTAEEVFRVNPDVIIVGGPYQHTIINQLQNTDGWKDLNAVVNGRVYNNPYGCWAWDRFGLESLLQLDYALLRIQPELAAGEGITEESMIQEIIDFYAYYNGKQLSVEEATNMFNGLLPDGTAEVPVA